MPRPLRQPLFYFSNIRTKRILCPRRLVTVLLPSPRPPVPPRRPSALPWLPPGSLPGPFPSAAAEGHESDFTAPTLAEEPRALLSITQSPRRNGLFVPPALLANSWALHPAVPGSRRGSRDAARDPLCAALGTAKRVLREARNACAILYASHTRILAERRLRGVASWGCPILQVTSDKTTGLEP